MRRRIRVVQISDVFETLRGQADIPIEFPPSVSEEAATVLPDQVDREDLRSVPFVTVDPPDALDLDQALAFEELAGGRLRLRYAISDVAAFVKPGGALDEEARRRGTTVYCPDMSVPLHPPLLSEGSASLLPGDDRPAVVFEIDVDADGAFLRCDVRRAVVRSRERFDYQTVQAAFATGHAPEPIAPLRRFGEARIARGIERGALTLRLPEQEAVQVGHHWTIASRPEVAAERWNAEVSLLTGMVAADLMSSLGTGILRTLPAATKDAIGRLRGDAKSLGIAWHRDESVSHMLAGLDPTRPRQMALFEAATRLLRGAGYLGFASEMPTGDFQHAGVAAPYAHVTAPLRRLADRFALAACLAASSGDPVPSWVSEAVEGIAVTMQQTDQRAGRVEAECINAVEAWVMEERIGERFGAVVLDRNGERGQIWIDDPPILASIDGVGAKPGQVISVEVHDTDIISGMIRFSRVD
jgi:exoribonuclease R